MAIDLDGAPAEGLEAVREHGAVVAIGRRTTLLQAVHVNDGDDPLQLVIGGELGRLPDAALGALAVAEQAEMTRLDAVQPVRDGHAVDGGEALAKGARGDRHPGVERGRVAFQIAVELAQGHRVVVDGAGLVQHRPEDGRGMTLGQQEAVLVPCRTMLGLRTSPGMPRVPTHLVEEQGGDKVGAGQAGGGMARTRGGGHAQHRGAQPSGHGGQRPGLVDGHEPAGTLGEALEQSVVGVVELLHARTDQFIGDGLQFYAE